MNNTNTIPVDNDNYEQQLAYDLVANTNRCLFITGKAGTGKTTFIQRIQKEIQKSFIVLAPTGIAAIAAGGQTLHSWMLRSMTTQFWGLWNGRIFRSKTTQSGDFTTKTTFGRRPIPEHCHPFRSITTQF